MKGVLAVDPGADGGFAWGSCKEDLQVARMPRTKGKIDIKALGRLIVQDIGFYDYCYFESVHAMPKQGVTSMFNFGRNVGYVISLITFLKANTEMKFVSPQKWQRDVLGRTCRGDKQLAVKWCQENQPQICLTPGRLKKPHSGISDALCIWQHGMNQYAD